MPTAPQMKNRGLIAGWLLMGAICRTAAAERTADATTVAAAAAWRPLLDEKLSAWEIWMGSPHLSVAGLPEGTSKSANARGNPPMGLGNDPKHVFYVRLE